MKKSILAISTAAAIGGMGFASTAHAVYYFGNSANETYAGIVMGGLFGVSHTTYRANATGVALNEAGVGNYLFTPYFSTQKDNNTLLSPRWPVQIPPPVATPNSPRQDWPDYDDSVLMAMREAASLRR